MARANATQVAGSNVNKSDIETRKFDLAGLSKEQWQILLDTRKISKNEKMIGKNPHDLWIIDTSGSNHMTRNQKKLCQ